MASVGEVVTLGLQRVLRATVVNTRMNGIVNVSRVSLQQPWDSLDLETPRGRWMCYLTYAS